MSSGNACSGGNHVLDLLRWVCDDVHLRIDFQKHLQALPGKHQQHPQAYMLPSNGTRKGCLLIHEQRVGRRKGSYLKYVTDAQEVIVRASQRLRSWSHGDAGGGPLLLVFLWDGDSAVIAIASIFNHASECLVVHSAASLIVLEAGLSLIFEVTSK
ncbi:hypothetical protein LZ30DRAFT_693087 [Colletotrichum cereale]|nr:hypothetical protein LZ30DRAFT_693087 [Colletotrichum cereale]